MHIRTGDTVIVISGDEKGKTGRVLAVFLDQERVLIEKINMIKRHTRPRSQTQTQGGIIEKEAPLHISNVALYDPKSKGATRVRYRVRYEKDGDRQVKVKDRLSAKTGEVIEKPAEKRA
ncbi:MAG: 50S ribosomal protein L24 [Candidatus Eisenbacteria sp.]|nr:50S ribosomal protein L24 [Candidatus Eisenbacteria bacterium]